MLYVGQKKYEYNNFIKYKDILSKAKPYLFCNAKNTNYFELNPLGIKVEDELIFDCLKVVWLLL